jgi:OOP family OmpA-OmpF porin
VVTDDDEDDVEDFLAAQGLTGAVDNDTSNFNSRVYGGYQFTPNAAVDFAYLTLGEVDVTARVTAPVDATVKIDSNVDGFEFVVTGACPISYRTDLTARLGGVYYDAEGGADLAGAVVGTVDVEDDGVAFTGGVGFSRKIGSNWIWRGGWQNVNVDKLHRLFLTGIACRFDW